jgi:Flp pilus assembly pilin Flp
MAVASETADARFAAGGRSSAAKADGNLRSVNRAAPSAPPVEVMPFRRTDMTALVNFIHTLRSSDEGQDLLEYALLVALIAIVAAGAVGMAGEQVDAIFTEIAGTI